MLSIAVCDDDELHRKRTVALIRNTPGFENSLIREFSRAENLLDSISEDHYLPDVAVLDIQMDEMDGIEVCHEAEPLGARVSDNISHGIYFICNPRL